MYVHSYSIYCNNHAENVGNHATNDLYTPNTRFICIFEYKYQSAHNI